MNSIHIFNINKCSIKDIANRKSIAYQINITTSKIQQIFL